MAKPEPEKKRQPAASAERRVLPMQLRTGDRSTRDGGGSRSREGCPLAVAVFRGRAAVFKDNFAAVSFGACQIATTSYCCHAVDALRPKSA